MWRQAAENVAESLTRGIRVIVTGRLKQRSYETKEGEKRTVYELEVDEVGPSLRNASAKVTKVTRTSGGAARPAARDRGPAGGYRRVSRRERPSGQAGRAPWSGLLGRALPLLALPYPDRSGTRPGCFPRRARSFSAP